MLVTETILALTLEDLERRCEEYEQTYHWSLFATHALNKGRDSVGKYYAIYSRFDRPQGAV